MDLHGLTLLESTEICSKYTKHQATLTISHMIIKLPHSHVQKCQLIHQCNMCDCHGAISWTLETKEIQTL